MIDQKDLKQYKHLKFVGDIHGSIKTLVWEIEARHKFTDTLVVVCGDIGLGFESPNFVCQSFAELSVKLAKGNNCLVLFRGNHDNPEYFNNPDNLTKCLTSYPNIILLKDWTVLETCVGNVLCIGGARSLDKFARIPERTWWKGENVPAIPDAFAEDIKSLKIDFVATHTCPLEAEPVCTDKDNLGKFVENWSVYDDTLKEDCWNERAELSEILKILTENGSPVKEWIYGHFHEHFEKTDEKTKVNFFGLDMLRQLKEKMPNGEYRHYSDWHSIDK